MCGIVGYVGHRKAAPVLVNGLKRLEYRGYDSSGLVTVDKDGSHRYRAVGRVKNLEKQIQGVPLNQTSGIAHTRWATHGKPTEENAHPHQDASSRFYIVHNGIIENHDKLRGQLIADGGKV